MMDYGLYFILTILISALFATIGLGSSLVLIPLLHALGIDFLLAKTVGLFANGVTTLSLSISNIKNKKLNFKMAIPLILIGTVFAILGAYSSSYISESIVKILFLFFIIISIIMLFVSNFFAHSSNIMHTSKIVLYIIVAIIAFISALLGLGGGALYLPLLIYFGLQTKESIVMVSAMIPAVSLSGFAAYATFVTIDWTLILVVGIGAIIGGLIGKRLLHRIHSQKVVKLLITSVLVAVIVQITLQISGGYGG